ncbi:hypothetical protein [Halorubellus salinus]|uniref:hypothetical protein n=1 Tax=Halorubellus salinus TaxID=755309 RepID=UPI001D06FFB1|nr:hypothetical protein [Halorubellus salinus]
MADLSSCYFCGAAMDVSLRESTVVPDALAPTPAHQTTVVLCGTCERKLERVLDPVVAAANASTDSQAAADDAATTDDADEVHGTTSGDADATVPPSILSDVADDGTSTTGDDDATADDTAGTEPTADDTAGSEPAADDGTPFEVDDTTSVFDDADDTASSSVFADANDTPTTPIQDAESDDDTDGIAFDDQSREETATNRESTSNAANASNASASNASTPGPSTDDASTSSSEPDTPDVDPRTYNKVVRLLKNRDLPVSRAEIESIAGSAYDIPDHECEAIIDAAIQRSLVAEADGQLTHPDGI